MTTLDDILKDVGGYVDGEAATPEGTDLTNRISYANRALEEWSDSDDWAELTKTIYFSLSQASQATLPLPTNFRKPMGALYEHNDGSYPYEYPLIDMSERVKKLESDRFAYLSGDYATGWNLIAPKTFASSASVFMDVQIFPSSLATLSDVPPLRAKDFITQRIIALVLESRSDSRFPLAKADADMHLARMQETQNAGNGGQKNQIKRPTDFIVGLDG